MVVIPEYPVLNSVRIGRPALKVIILDRNERIWKTEDLLCGCLYSVKI